MNHARDASTSFQDDRTTRKCANRSQKTRPRTLANPQKWLSESPGSVPEHPPGRPRIPRGAPRSRQAENMQTAAERAPTPPSQREHLYNLSHAAPPVLNLPLTLPANPVLAYRPCQASPPAGPMGSADSTGLRPLPPTPKEDLVDSNLRMARSYFACEYLDEEFNPDE